MSTMDQTAMGQTATIGDKSVELERMLASIVKLCGATERQVLARAVTAC